MGVLNDLKRVLFGAKSVAKSAADKTIEAGKEKGQELVDKSGELFDRATEKVEKIGAVVIDKAEDIGQKIWTETEDFVAKARQYAENVTNPPKEEKAAEPIVPVTDVPPMSTTPETPIVPPVAEEAGSKIADAASEATKKAEQFAEEVGSKVLYKAADVGKKAEGIAEEVGSKVLDAADKLGEKAADAGEKLKEVSENIGSVVIEKSGELYEKAKSFGENMLNKADELVEKAQREAEAEAKLDETTNKAQQLNDLLSSKVEESTPKTGPIETKEGMLDKHDSFFDRAKRFADGDYHNEGSKPTSLFSKPDDTTPQNKKGGKAAGFDDLDGDGNELIDDAIVED